MTKAPAVLRQAQDEGGFLIFDYVVYGGGSVSNS